MTSLAVSERFGETRRGPSMRLRLKPLENITNDTFVVHEIYTSIQGEGTRAGLACSFIRLSGCHLRCSYCDTPHAFSQGTRMQQVDVVAAVEREAPRLVLLTGGEPLLHPGAAALMTTLCDRGFTVLLETSGSLATDGVDARVITIVDVKLPSSGEWDANDWDNLTRLRPHDEVKFVIGDEKDFHAAKTILSKYDLAKRCTILFGCVFDALPPKTLCEWILRDRLPVRLQLQMHRYIWAPNERGV